MADIPTLTTLTIPVSVSSIGNRAFACPNLSTVHYNARRAVVYNRNNYNNYDGYIFATAPVSNLTIGDSVECIPYNFLYGDTLLTSVTIPASVDTIGHQAFYGTGLTTLTIPVSVKAIGNRAFMCPYLTTLHYNARRIDPDYDNGTNNIFGGYIEDYYYEDYYYYYWIVPVANLTIGDSVEFVPYNFLYRDTLLTSVSLPASVRHIGGNAFCDTRLTSVTIPANMDTIGSNAFSMPTLASVHYNATNLQEAGSESYSPFSNGDGVPQTLTIGSNVRTLPEGVFGYMKISSVTLPDSLQSIGDHCFQNTRLTSVTIPDYVSGIGGWAFASYDVDGTSFSGAMRRVVIGSRVSSIGNYAFAGITNPDTIFVRATVPPTIVAHTFEAMPTNAAIILPCGTTQSYQNASYWNSFSRMGEDPSCYNLITVQANNATMGSVSGGGRYSTGNIATLSAMPRNNHAFVGWVDGSVDNPRLVLVSGDASYTANFAPSSGGIVHDTVTHTDTVVIDHHDTVFVGGTDTIYIYDTVYIHDTVFIHHRDTVNIVGYDDIRGISGQTEVLLYSNGGKIVVEGADGMPVRVYDSVGRLLSIRKENTGVVWFDVPASGTYLVRVGDYPARRIVVIR